MAETAMVTTYVKGGKRRHPASYRKPPAKTVFKTIKKATTGGTKHSGSISTSGGG